MLLLIGISCSKEKQLERSLHKKDGIWDIDKISWTIVQQDTSGQSIETGGVETNAGTFTFDKGGSGSYDYTVAGTKRANTFSWQVDGSDITISRISQSINSNFEIEQIVISFTGSETSKNNIELTGSEIIQEVGGVNIDQFVLTGTFNLSK
ncbi:MAG: hypothetical protein FVQ77_10770 [Cytophagales bacterium]|nr:hypothetical protein [Cytophagales bacterium]